MRDQRQGDVFRGVDGDYVAETWDAETGDTSGFRPHGKNVLIRMDAAARKTRGGIAYTDDHLDMLDAKSETGVLCAIGPAAWRHFDDGAPWTGDRPQIGERVFVSRFSGLMTMGKDGKLYRLMDYGCVMGGLALAELAEAQPELKGVAA